MKPLLTLRRIWAWLPHETWLRIYAVITALLLLFLASAYLLDYLKATLP